MDGGQTIGVREVELVGVAKRRARRARRIVGKVGIWMVAADVGVGGDGEIEQDEAKQTFYLCSFNETLCLPEWQRL